MNQTISISIPCDKDGFLTLTCPSCRQNFKLLGDDFQDDSVVDIYCPHCGLSNSTNDFLTNDVKEAVNREAENLVAKLLNDSFKKMALDIKRSKYIKMTTIQYTNFSQRPPTELTARPLRSGCEPLYRNILVTCDDVRRNILQYQNSPLQTSDGPYPRGLLPLLYSR